MHGIMVEAMQNPSGGAGVPVGENSVAVVWYGWDFRRDWELQNIGYDIALRSSLL
jgi:hypothetical protein